MIKLEGNVGLRKHDKAMCLVLPTNGRVIEPGLVKWVNSKIARAKAYEIEFAGWAIEPVDGGVLVCQDPSMIMELNLTSARRHRYNEISFNRQIGIIMLDSSLITMTALVQLKNPIQKNPMGENLSG